MSWFAHHVIFFFFVKAQSHIHISFQALICKAEGQCTVTDLMLFARTDELAPPPSGSCCHVNRVNNTGTDPTCVWRMKSELKRMGLLFRAIASCLNIRLFIFFWFCFFLFTGCLHF